MSCAKRDNYRYLTCHRIWIIVYWTGHREDITPCLCQSYAGLTRAQSFCYTLACYEHKYMRWALKDCSHYSSDLIWPHFIWAVLDRRVSCTVFLSTGQESLSESICNSEVTYFVLSVTVIRLSLVLFYATLCCCIEMRNIQKRDLLQRLQDKQTDNQQVYNTQSINQSINICSLQHDKMPTNNLKQY